MIPITAALVAEHRLFCAVFDQIDDLLSMLASLAEVKKLARLVEGLLLSHAATEQDLLLLAMQQGPVDNHHIGRFCEEHLEIEASLTRVHSSHEPKQARGLLQAALLASRKHFDREEKLIFPFLERVIQPEILMRLGTSWFLRNHAPANWVI